MYTEKLIQAKLITLCKEYLMATPENTDEIYWKKKDPLKTVIKISQNTVWTKK